MSARVREEYGFFQRSVRPVVGHSNGLLMLRIHAVGAVGLAVEHVQTELAVIAVVRDGLIAVGHGVLL